MSDETADNTLDHDPLDVELLLRSLTADDLAALEAPPASVWAGIQAQLAASGDFAPVADAPAVVAVAPAVVSIAEHRARRSGRYRLLAAAAAVIAVTAAVGVFATRGDDGADVVAAAALTYDAADPGFDPLGIDATATAELVRDGDGYQIVLTDAQLPTGIEPNEDFELWLISTDPTTGEITDVQPVDKLAGVEGGTYAVPAELDPETYTVVDISIEPRDGDAAHSNRSILRGELQA